MPEGDTIHIAALNLRKVLDGLQITEATGRPDVIDAASLIGTRVTGIEARGMHLMIRQGDAARSTYFCLNCQPQR